MIGIILALLLQQTVSGTVTVVMNATDDTGVASVQCFLDGAPLGPNFTAPSTAPSTYSFAWNTMIYPNGPHTLTAKAIDRAGNVGQAAPVPVVISNIPADTTPPTIQILTPIAGSTVSGKINVQAAASDNATVSAMALLIAGQQKAASSNGSLLYNWNTNPYKRQTVALSVTASDPSGNVASKTITVNVK